MVVVMMVVVMMVMMMTTISASAWIEGARHQHAPLRV